jgi:3-keto-disaccharide hydrolase
MAWFGAWGRRALVLGLGVLALVVILVGVVEFSEFTELFDAWRADGPPASLSAAAALTVPESAAVERFDFEQRGLEGWRTVNGRWAIESMDGAPSGTHVLVQRAVENTFNVIVAPAGPYTDVDVSVKFKPISGREDASGGIAFRFSDGKYYVVRANALEDNFRVYYYDRGRWQLASAHVTAPALGQWHTIRVVAVGDHMQAWLDGTLYLDHRDGRFKAGRVGLWTKADSVTAFDDLTIRGVTGAGS